LLVINLPISPKGRIGIIAVFATMHGLAHGVELGTTQNSILQWPAMQSMSMLSGILLATALLHALGFVVGMQGHRVTKWLNMGLAFVMLVTGGVFLLN
jgi:urease accessory protein